MNNTADADRGDESPVLPLFSAEQKEKKRQLKSDIERLEKLVNTTTPELAKAQGDWEKTFEGDIEWRPLAPSRVTSDAGAGVKTNGNRRILFERGGKTDVYRLEAPLGTNETITALRIETIPDDNPPGRGVGHAGGNFVVTRVKGSVLPPKGARLSGRFVRVELPGKDKMLSLAEVQVFDG